ncbi:helix-turn-helix domain-containing protein [Nonomuraea sp. NPDC052129]|uniref:winged helix-turn-helix transcriptional regulator n=1 Tax=Nonomuraea sp. NPDC052129 TaxID=3154651 RepID=UPI00341D798D
MNPRPSVSLTGERTAFLVVRDVAGGTTRFDGLQRELGVSRRALAERLAGLVEHGVLEKRPYSDHPPRYDYLLIAKGAGLLPASTASRASPCWPTPMRSSARCSFRSATRPAQWKTCSPLSAQ